MAQIPLLRLNSGCMRKPLRLILFGAVLLPAIAAILVYSILDANQIAPLLTQSLSRNVTLALLKVKPFPLAFTATELTIADDPQFSREPFLTSQSIVIRPALLPLLQGKLEIASLEISSPQLSLIEARQGSWNIASLSSGGNSRPFTLDHLSITNATVHLRRPSRPTATYTRIHAELRNYRPQQPFSLTLGATLPNSQTLSFSGTLSPAGPAFEIRDGRLNFASLAARFTGKASSSSLDLKAEIPSSPIASAAPLFLPSDLKASGDVSANIQVSGTPQSPQLSGNLQLRGFEVSGSALKQPVRTPQLDMTFTPDRLTLAPARITSGSTQLQAFGVLARYASDPLLEATLIAPSATLPELLAIARAYGLSGLEGVSSTGQAQLQVRAHGRLKANAPLEYTGSGKLENATLSLPSLNRPLTIPHASFRFAAGSAQFSNTTVSVGSTTISGDLSVANFARPVLQFSLSSERLNLDEIRSLLRPSSAKSDPPSLTASGSLRIGSLQASDLVLTQLNAHASYRDAHLMLNPLTASLYGGRHTGSLDIDLRPATPVYHLKSQLDRIESSQFLAATTSVKNIISGPFSSAIDVRFSPADPAHLAQSINGKINLNFKEGRIASFNLTNELSRIGQFLGFNPSSTNITQFLGITGELDLKNGLATTQDLKLNLSNLSASLSGTMNLADQTLNLKLLSVLDRRFSDQVGGNKVGGILTAALATPSGNLLIPATIRGTFAKPLIAPDPGELARLKVQSFNPRDPNQMRESVNSLIDLFRKKKN